MPAKEQKVECPFFVFYLELSMRLGLPLATLDTRLKAAAITVCVPIFGVQ